MQTNQQVSALEIQHRDTQQHLQTAQAAVREQSHLLERERAAIGQQTELVAIETLEANIHRAQEVCKNAKYTCLVPSCLFLLTSTVVAHTYRQWQNRGCPDVAPVVRRDTLSQQSRQATSKVLCQLTSATASCKSHLNMQANARMQQVLQRREAEANHTAMLDGVMRLVKDLNVELKQLGAL